jgi:Fe2+ transport system protein FeoA
MLLSQVKKDTSCTIKQVLVTGEVLSRLNSLGVSAGRRVTVKGTSIFNSSVMISAGSRLVAIRQALAEKIVVNYD